MLVQNILDEDGWFTHTHLFRYTLVPLQLHSCQNS